MDGVIVRIKELIEHRDTTRNAVAERAGLGRGVIYKALSGERSGMSVDTLLAIARALDASVDWILTGEGERDRKWASLPAAAEQAPQAMPDIDALADLVADKLERRKAAGGPDVALRGAKAAAAKADAHEARIAANQRPAERLKTRR